ncbi:hypothetical protein NCAS_0A04050 [Naumovozyma castellii]|uniref:RIC1 C-terminal alpha solenoid region domain-containing protein n=1 Tax=Naumovozyma castellii TaxID=27288 RepID=G0V671_NAUCA|nr:hypothetical protein NCAS_0A04050 [Naumovozyma castellii CBS 4309]CCC66963.1 hypothetical protein NCAS_0A04050 [Naumovozyma castellii CBS 4309]
MHLWPVCPPQKFTVAPRSTDLPELEINDNEIKQILPLPSSNALIYLHPARVSIYNFKPLALVEAHERSKESIDEFGVNRFIATSTSLTEPVKAFLSEREVDCQAWPQGKVVFYVVTDKNYVLAYQILKNSTSLTIFQEYGIPIVNPIELRDNINHDYDNDSDDDTLTVFEKNNSSKIIQNGYTVTKARGFLNFLSSNNENLEEIPVKKLELRLKIVLKFDFEIVSILGFKRFSKEGDGKFEENLLVLFPHGLQILNLVDFKLNKNSLIKIENCKQICICNGLLLVISESKEDNSITVNEIDAENQTATTTTILNKSGLISSFEFNGKVTLVFEDHLDFFDPKLKKITYSWSTTMKIKICKQLNEKTLAIVSKNNNLHFFSNLGNLLFSTNSDDELLEKNLDYSDIMCLDQSLLTVASTGDFEFWQLWKESQQTFSDFRASKPHVLHDKNNDIIVFSPSADISIHHDAFQNIKLPTKTLNNLLTMVRINASLKLLSTYISNKNMLLLQNLETNIWYHFRNITILDMHWLGNTYLLCHLAREDGTRALQCFRFPLQGIKADELSTYSIWEFDIPEQLTVFSVHVNTLFRYKLLKIKPKENVSIEVQTEKFFKTAEIILVTNSQIMIIDVISVVHPSGINIIKKFHQYASVTIPTDVNVKHIEWITNYRDGLLFLSDHKIFKIGKLNAEEWQSVILLNNIERIVDVLNDEVFLIQKNECVVYKLESLWEDKKASLTIPLEENLYPISISPETATIYSLKCVFNSTFSRLLVKHEIYLDKVITAELDEGVDPEEITLEYKSLKHYKFALEKILSSKVLMNQPLDGILALVKLCDNVEGSTATPRKHTDLLEIISNCLRKMETKYWNKIFSGLEMTPRDLLAFCLEGNEAKIMGVLLLVFINYDDSELVQDLRMDENQSQAPIPEEEEVSQFRSEHSVLSLVKDEELMLRILRLLVTSAANATDSSKASESWDMCFQLIRLLSELDRQNNTDLVEKAMTMFQ